MNILLLDADTLGEGIDLSPFEALGQVFYGGTVKDEQTMLALAAHPQAGGAQAIVCSKAPVTKAVMDAFKNLKYVGVFATGYNNVDIEAAKERGVALCNVPGYSGGAVAQLVFTFILMSAGCTHLYIEETGRGDWISSPSFSMITHKTVELEGKTLGILGYGDIGKRVAALGRAFGMRVIVHTRTPRDDSFVTFVSREALLKESDFLSLNAPLTPKTADFINEESLALMKKSAVLINTARGGLVNEQALAEALKMGRISCACLDVLKSEPMAKDCPLFGLKNCYITPHIAWTPTETRERLSRIAAENLDAFLKGEEKNRVV